MNGTIGTVRTFFASSTTRTEESKHIIETTSFETLNVNAVKKKKLKLLSQTRWV